MCFLSIHRSSRTQDYLANKCVYWWMVIKLLCAKSLYASWWKFITVVVIIVSLLSPLMFSWDVLQNKSELFRIYFVALTDQNRNPFLLLSWVESIEAISKLIERFFFISSLSGWDEIIMWSNSFINVKISLNYFDPSSERAAFAVFVLKNLTSKMYLGFGKFYDVVSFSLRMCAWMFGAHWKVNSYREQGGFEPPLRVNSNLWTRTAGYLLPQSASKMRNV